MILLLPISLKRNKMIKQNDQTIDPSLNKPSIDGASDPNLLTTSPSKTLNNQTGPCDPNSLLQSQSNPSSSSSNTESMILNTNPSNPLPPQVLEQEDLQTSKRSDEVKEDPGKARGKLKEPEHDDSTSKSDEIKGDPEKLDGNQACFSTLGSKPAADIGGGSSSHRQIGDEENNLTGAERGITERVEASDTVIHMPPASMPNEDLCSPAWKETIANEITTLRTSNTALGGKITKVENLHNEFIVKVEGTLQDMKKTSLFELHHKKAKAIITILLLAITVLMGYNLALIVLSKKCKLYAAGLMLLSIVGILAFGWTALSTMMESASNWNDLNTSLLHEGTSQSSYNFKCLYMLPTVVVCLFAVAYTICGVCFVYYCQ